MEQEECFYDSLDEEQFNKEVKLEAQKRKRISRIPVLVGSTIGPCCRLNTSLSLRSNSSSINEDKSICSQKSKTSHGQTKHKKIAASKKSSVIPLKLILDVQNDLIEKELRQNRRTYLDILKQRMKETSYNNSYSRRRRSTGAGGGGGATAGPDEDSESLISNCNSLSSRHYPSTIYSAFSYAGPEYDTASMYDNYKVFPASNMFELKKVVKPPEEKEMKDDDDSEDEDEDDDDAEGDDNEDEISNKSQKKPDLKDLIRNTKLIPDKTESLYIEKCSESDSFAKLEHIMNNLKSVSEVCVMLPGKSYRTYKRDDYEGLNNLQVSGGLGADMLSPERIQKLEKLKKMTEYGLKASIRNRAKIIAKIKVKEE